MTKEEKKTLGQIKNIRTAISETLSTDTERLNRLQENLNKINKEYINNKTITDAVSIAQSDLTNKFSDLNKKTGEAEDNFDKLFKGLGKGFSNARESFVSFWNVQTDLGSNIEFWKEYNKRVREVAITYGISIDKINEFNEANLKAEKSAVDAGLEAREYRQGLEALYDTTDKLTQISPEFGRDLANISKVLDIDTTTAARFLGAMNNLNVGFDGTVKILEDLRYSAEKSALNTNKVLKVFTDNFEKLNTYSFKNGVQGMIDMVKQSVNLRVNMDKILSLSDDFTDPEKTMEFASNMQLLGGSFAQLGDFNQLMYDAAVAPEELAKNIAKASANMGSFDRETGKFTVSFADRLQLKEAAKQMGMTEVELNKMAAASAKVKDIRVALNFKNLTEEQYDTLGALSEFDPSRGEYVVRMKDERGEEVKKSIAELNDEDIKKLAEEKTKTTLQEQRVAKMDVESLVVAKTEGLKYTTLDTTKTMGLESEYVRSSVGGIMDSFDKALQQNLKDKVFVGIEKLGASLSEEYVAKSLKNLSEGVDGLSDVIGSAIDSIKNAIKTGIGSELPEGEVKESIKKSLNQGTVEKQSQGGILNNFKYSEGTILEGLSHSKGGIPFTIGGKPGFEAEGGEVLLTKGVSKDPNLLKTASEINEAAGGKKLYADGGIITDTKRIDKYNITNTFDLTKINQLFSNQTEMFGDMVTNFQKLLSIVEYRKNDDIGYKPSEEKKYSIDKNIDKLFVDRVEVNKSSSLNNENKTSGLKNVDEKEYVTYLERLNSYIVGGKGKVITNNSLESKELISSLKEKSDRDKTSSNIFESKYLINTLKEKSDSEKINKLITNNLENKELFSTLKEKNDKDKTITNNLENKELFSTLKEKSDKDKLVINSLENKELFSTLKEKNDKDKTITNNLENKEQYNVLREKTDKDKTITNNLESEKIIFSFNEMKNYSEKINKLITNNLENKEQYNVLREKTDKDKLITNNLENKELFNIIKEKSEKDKLITSNLESEKIISPSIEKLKESINKEKTINNVLGTKEQYNILKEKSEKDKLITSNLEYKDPITSYKEKIYEERINKITNNNLDSKELVSNLKESDKTNKTVVNNLENKEFFTKFSENIEKDVVKPFEEMMPRSKTILSEINKNVYNSESTKSFENLTKQITSSGVDKIGKIQGGLIEKRPDGLLSNITVGGTVNVGGKIDFGTIKVDINGTTKEIATSDTLKKEIMGHVEKMINSQNKNLYITQITQKNTGLDSGKKPIIHGITDVGDGGVASWFS